MRKWVWERRLWALAQLGCGVFIYKYIDIDFQEAAHGRAAAVATAIKRVMPNHLVFTYQGDGDAAGIGTNETIHSLNRGEGIVIVFINNAIYGMTGGQMAPTTLMGQMLQQVLMVARLRFMAIPSNWQK